MSLFSPPQSESRLQSPAAKKTTTESRHIYHETLYHENFFYNFFKHFSLRMDHGRYPINITRTYEAYCTCNSLKCDVFESNPKSLLTIEAIKQCVLYNYFMYMYIRSFFLSITNVKELYWSKVLLKAFQFNDKNLYTEERLISFAHLTRIRDTL